MAANLIVMPGAHWLDLSPLVAVAGEFGWNVDVIDDKRRISAAGARRKAVAVLFCRDAFGQDYSWREAIRLTRLAFPGLPAIPLHGFAESADWSELSGLGAFHSLWLPLKENEVRQSCGFLSAAAKHSLRVMTVGSIAEAWPPAA